MTGNNKYFYLIICGYFSVLAFRHLGISELVYFGGDESRHFMNGVFIRDLIADRGWVSPSTYLQWYYLKYPALSIHQYPPLFYILEALIISVFGIKIYAVQIFIYLAIIVSLFCWYLYITKKFTSEIALLSCIVFVSTEIFLLNFSHIMLETSALSLIIIGIYYLDKWQETGLKRYFYASCIVALLASMVAFKAFFFLVYILIFVVAIKTSNRPFSIRLLYVASCFFSVFLLFFTFGTVAQLTGHPLLYRTMQGANMLSIFKIQTFFSSPATTDFFRFHFIQTFEWYTILLPLAGLVFLAQKRQWHKITGELLYGATFLFIFSLCITHYVPMRFSIFLLPPVALLSAYSLYSLIKLVSGRYYYWAFAITAAFFMCIGLAHAPLYFRGYEAAAHDMVNWNKGKHPILFAGYHDGAFVQNVRKYDPQKELVVFRGSKIFYSASIYYHDKFKSYVNTANDVYTILDTFSIRYVFVDNFGAKITEKATLLRTLQDTENFRYIRTYSVSTNSPRPEDQKGELTVFEYLRYNVNYEQNISVDIPVMQADFSITINDLKKPFQKVLVQ